MRRLHIDIKELDERECIILLLLILSFCFFSLSLRFLIA